MQLYMEDQSHQLVESIQILIEAIRREEAMSNIRNNIDRIVNAVENVLETSTKGATEPSPYQNDWRSQTSPIHQNLEGGKQRLVQASADCEMHERSPSAKEFTSSLPPLAFQVARETRELVRRVQELKSGEDDFS
jgi:hypothetical protein